MTFMLLRVEVAGFRGFNDRRSIDFDERLTAIYAPNGHGKSSLCEAIEWGLFGSTLRKERGEASGQTKEFANSLRNRHFPKEQDAYVSLLLWNGTTEVHLKRIVTTDEGPGRLLIDDREAKSIAELGASDTVKYPIILQHALRDFILSKPSERFDRVSQQFGIGSFTAFQTALQNARTNFKKKPEDVDRAMRMRKETLDKWLNVHELAPVVEVLGTDKATPKSLRSAVGAVFEASTSRPLSDGEAAISEISAEMATRIAKVFDSTKLRIDIDVEPLFTTAAENIDAICEDVDSSQTDMVAGQQLEQFRIQAELVELATRSLRHIGTEDPKCPVCRRPLDAEHSMAIEAESKRQITVPQPLEHLRRWRHKSSQVEQTVRMLEPVLLGQDDVDTLTALLKETPDTMNRYSGLERELAASRFAISTTIDAVPAECDSVQERLDVDGGGSVSLQPLSDGLKNLRAEVEAYRGIRRRMIALYTEIRNAVRDKVVTSEEVAPMRLLLDVLTNADALVLACRDSATEDLADKAVKTIQAFGTKKRDEILTEKGQDMARLFSNLHSGTDVKFKGISVSSREIKLLGEVFGEGVSVSSAFSEAELNCLGLSYYAVSTLSPDNAFDFVIIDDPIQSMDQAHIESFKLKYLAELLGSGKQVILLTHMLSLAESVRRLYRRYTPLLLEVKCYGKAGPVIDERYDPLVRLPQDIGYYMLGGSDSRIHAGQLMRKLAERIAKEAYEAKHYYLPPKYARESWRKLEELLPQGVLSAEEQDQLNDFYEFAVSFPHDDMVNEPPTTDEIRAKMREIMKITEMRLKRPVRKRRFARAD